MNPTLDELLDRRVACYQSWQVAKEEAEAATAKAHRVMAEAHQALTEAEHAEGRVRMYNLRYKALSESIRQMEGTDIQFLKQMEVNDDR